MQHDDSFFSALFVYASLGLAALSGCFQPELPTGQFKCDKPQDTCPTDMQCVSGLCQRRVDNQEAPPAVDMAMTPLIMGSKGCTGSGMMLASAGGKDAHACVGSFPSNEGNATSLCAAGYHLCKSSDSALLFDARASGRCDSLQIGGFFAADVLAGYDASDKLICEPKVAVTTPALVGCGDEKGTRVLAAPCQDLIAAAPCDATVDGWNCASDLSNATHSAGKPGGVLCCQN